MTPPHFAVAAQFLAEWHHALAFGCAAAFPALRLVRRKVKGHGTRMDSILHQAATGFVFPAFVMLCVSYSAPQLLDQISPHEMGLAGLLALLTSLRELAVDGVDDEPLARR